MNPPSSYYNAWQNAIGTNPSIRFNTFSDIVGFFIPYALTLGGIILFFMIAAGGFTMLVGAADKESQEKGKKMATNGILGFFILFLAYWIAQILQVIFNISIVS